MSGRCHEDVRDKTDPYANGDDLVATELHVGKPATKDGDDADEELEEQDEGVGELEAPAQGSG